MDKISPEEGNAAKASLFEAALETEGITPVFLAKKLKSELKAKEVKAQVSKVASEFVYSKPMIAWDVRQKARMDAHKLLGHYPAEKHELSGGLTYQHSPEERDFLKQLAVKLAESIRGGNGNGHGQKI